MLEIGNWTTHVHVYRVSLQRFSHADSRVNNAANNLLLQTQQFKVIRSVIKSTQRANQQRLGDSARCRYTYTQCHTHSAH